MEKLLGWIGMAAGGWLGWAIGERSSIGLAIVLGVVGTGLGLYVARRVVRDYF